LVEKLKPLAMTVKELKSRIQECDPKLLPLPGVLVWFSSGKERAPGFN
jgi:hypothetical protein